MKKFISLALFIVMLLGVMSAVFSVSAKEPDAFGDLDANYSVTAGDALIALQGAVKKITLTDAQEYYADIDLDEKINATDALYILQYAVGKLSKIPFSDFVKYDDLLVDLPESNLDNGAYSRDVSADTSFRITTDGLEDETIYLINASTYNMRNDIITKDAARFVFSLQGLINRDFGITHSSLIFQKSDTTEKFWFEYMTAEGNQFEGYNVVEINKLETFIGTFAAQIDECGIILWDPNVPSTANVAATICGLDGYIPVKYDTSEKSFYTTLLGYVDDGYLYDGIERMSLVDMFDGELGTEIADTDIESTGSAKCDAYLWAAEKYMSRCSTKFMAYVPDGSVAVEGNVVASYGDVVSPYSVCLYNHDYYIARRCFFFDLTAYAGEAPCDDPDQPVGTDSQTYLKLLEYRYNRANGDFGQMLGFPPWWIKYTAYKELASIGEVHLEWLTVEFNTLYNMSKEADAAHPCALANCSVYYKYISTTEEFVNNEPEEEIEYDPDTYYYLIYLGDYDSSAWLANHIPVFWNDENHGTVPSAWGFNPNLSDRVPMVFDFVYSNAEPNDYFITSDSGAGYVYPSALVEGHVVSTRSNATLSRTNPTATEKFASYSKPYYDVFDMDITGFILNVGYSMNKDVLEMYNELSPVGSMFQCHDNDQRAFMYNGVPYVYQHWANGVTGQKLVDNALYNFGGSKFSSHRTICYSPTKLYNFVEEINEYAELNDIKVQNCDPYTFFSLMKESDAVPEWNGVIN